MPLFFNRHERKSRLKVAHAVGESQIKNTMNRNEASLEFAAHFTGVETSSNLCVLVMGSATLLAFLGLKAVFDFHAEKGIPHTYSLHSWFDSLYPCQQL